MKIENKSEDVQVTKDLEVLEKPDPRIQQLENKLAESQDKYSSLEAKLDKLLSVKEEPKTAVLVNPYLSLDKENSDFQKQDFTYVTVKRLLESFRLKDHAVILADANMSIGSFVDRDTNTDVRPLSLIEERMIMPEILGIKSESEEFSLKVKQHFADITAYVPAEGLKLNISTQPITFEGKTLQKPLVPLDYCIYRLVMKHVSKNFKIASSFEQGDPETHRYYIEDLTFENNKQNDNYKIKQDAMFEFMQLTHGKKAIDNKEKLAMIFDLTYSLHKDSSFGKKPEDLVRLLDEKVVSKDPSTFLKIVQDEDLEDKALVARCLTFNILSKQGNTYFEDNLALGDLDETIRYFNNPEHSGYRMKLKAKLEEKIKFVK